MSHDVVIAGAGPVGLMLACELRLAGVTVLVLEQAVDPQSPLKQLPFGMRGLSTPTVEAFYRRGMLDAILAQQLRRHTGHFAGIPLDDALIDTERWPYRVPGPAPLTVATDMAHVEAVLTARAIALGVELRRGVAVESVAQDEDAVTVRAGGESTAARWLVGCDGGRSVVRKAAGFDFVGTDPEFTGYSVQVDLAEPLPLGRHYTPTGMYAQMRPGTIAMVEFDGGAFHRTDAITRDHVQAVLRRVTGLDVTVTALQLATTWTDRAYQATTYRQRRVLLAGDAAHIHSPLGGQGLNLGIGDAMNLGWKLAATVRGDAPADLLDTYTAERHPVGAQVLDWSRAQVALMKPSPHSRALEAILRDVIGTRDGATYFAERAWAVTLRYDLGRSHPLVGRSAPDFELVDGRRLGALLAAGRGVLLDFEGTARLRALGDRVDYLACSATDPLGLRAVVIRPDGIVAWVDGDGDAEDAVTRWFGGARPHARREDGRTGGGTRG